MREEFPISITASSPRVDTLRRARLRLLDELSERGKGTCPCCGRIARYRRVALSSGLAWFLIRLYKLGLFSDGRWVHYSDAVSRGSKKLGGLSYGDLRHWKLIEPRYDAKPGQWRLTHHGKLFVNGERSVEKRLLIFDGKVRKRSEETTTIKQALGTRFDYDDLMKGVL